MIVRRYPFVDNVIAQMMRAEFATLPTTGPR